MAMLDVNPADLLRSAAAYSELASRVAELSPRAVAEVERIAATHGPMGFPAVAGIAAGMANAEGPLNAKVADFQTYSQRFTEHAATYVGEDREAASQYGTVFDPAIPLSGNGIGPVPVPEGRVICTPMLGGFACSEFLPGGMIYHWLSPADLTGHWPDFP